VRRAFTTAALLSALAAGCGGVSSNLPRPPAVQQGWEGAPGLRGDLPADGAWWTWFHDPVLDRLVAMADTDNLDLRLASARVREARALHAAAAASLFPQLTGSAGAAAERAVLGAPPTSSPSLTLGATASWEADVFGRLRHEASAQDALVHGSIAEAEGVRLSLVVEVVRSYVELRLAQSQRDIATRNAAAAAETLRIGRLRFEQGLGSRLDVERPTTALAETRAQVAVAVERAESARHRLALLLATTPASLAQALPAEGALPQMDPLAVLLTPTDVISRRPDVRAAGHAFVAASARREAAAALQWPRLTLAASVGVDGNLAALPWTAIANLSAGLLAPIFDFGRIRAGVDAADARQEQAALAYERVARVAVNDVQAAVVAYAQGLVRRDELSTAVAAARKAGEIAHRQYAEGTISLLEVLDAERAQRDTELAWSQAAAEVSLRAVRLYQAMGIVSPQGPRS